MQALWNDWRKTALGACGLALLAVMFTHEGGVAETAVSSAEEMAGRKQDEINAGGEAHKAWFAADESDYEVTPVAPPPQQQRPEAAPTELSATVVQRPEPVGPDFPAGLKPPA